MKVTQKYAVGKIPIQYFIFNINVAYNLSFLVILQADSNDTINEAQLYGPGEEVYSGLRTQDLQEAKDQLLVETSDMLNIPLFTAEALLRDNGERM